MATCAESALLHALHLSRPLSRWVLPTLRGLMTLGARERAVDALGLGFGDDGGERFLDAHRLSLVFRVGAPDQDIGYPINTKKSGTHGGLLDD